MVQTILRIAIQEIFLAGIQAPLSLEMEWVFPNSSNLVNSCSDVLL